MMKKVLFIGTLFLTFVSTAKAQKFTAEKSSVTFYSHATIEDIKATTTKAISLLNAGTGDIAFSIQIKDFVFEKSLMQEHFNEKYMESEKYPKATFQGKLEGFEGKSTTQQNVTAKGKLTIHGVTNEVSIPATITKQNSKYVANAKFMVKLVDYKVEIPQLLWKNIAEQVEVTVDFTYQPQ
jgi:polyisoprenoid-binding protein YceI